MGKRKGRRASAASGRDGAVGLDLSQAVVAHDRVGARVTGNTVDALGRRQRELILRVSVQEATEAVATVLTRP